MRTEAQWQEAKARWEAEEGVILNKSIFRKFISVLFEESDELPSAEMGDTGYLDSWNEDGEPVGFGTDENGRMFFVTPKLKVVHNDHLVGKKEGVIQIRFFERFSLDTVPIVCSDNTYSGARHIHQPCFSAVHYESFQAIVMAMKGKKTHFERTTINGEKDTWDIELYEA